MEQMPPSSETDMADAIRDLAKAIDRHADHTKPIGEFFEGATVRVEKLCVFLKKKGPWLLALGPTALLIVQSVSPSAAAALKAIIASLPAGG